MPQVELFVAPLCPFAMRARIAAAEKGVEATEVEIDIHNKPSWFVELSPNGKVPLLRHGDHLVWESAIIAEYLDEAFPGHPLMPATAEMRAKARAWVNFADVHLYAKTGVMLHSKDPKIHAQLAAELAYDLTQLATTIFDDSKRHHPYWLGADFTLADAAFYPWFEQLCVLEEFRGFEFPQECQSLLTWKDEVANRSAIQPIMRPPAFYIEEYGKLLASLNLETSHAPA